MSESTVAGNATPADALHAFRQQALQAVARLGATANLMSGDIAHYAALAGLPSDIRSDGTGYTLPDIPDETTGPQGLPRDQFTQAALDAHDAAVLFAVKKNVYHAVRRLVRNLSIPVADAGAALESLGLPVPAVKSAVQAHVTGVGTLNFTVPGTVTEEEVVTQLTPLASSPAADAIRTAFPNATHTEELVYGVYITEDLSWPALKA